MPNEIEIEAKALLSKEDYEKLLKRFSSFPVRTQTNHYIDDPSFSLQKNRFALRVREIDEHFEMTLKTDLEEGRLERNLDISKEEFLAIKEKGVLPEGDAKDFLLSKGVNLSSLRVVFYLTTIRAEGKFDGGVLSIDKNLYGDKIDYELEYESSSLERAYRVVRGVLDELNIPFVPSFYPKIKRAMDEYLNNRK